MLETAFKLEIFIVLFDHVFDTLAIFLIENIYRPATVSFSISYIKLVKSFGH